MKFLIMENKFLGRYEAFDEEGIRRCSDPDYECCVIKIGLLGFPMKPVSLNSRIGRSIEHKVYTRQINGLKP